MSFGAFFSENLFTFILFFLALAMLAKVELTHFRQRTPKITVLGLSQALENGAELWDLRPRDVYKKGHISQALSHPAEQIAVEKLKQSKTQTIVLYDDDERLSQKIAQQMRAAGYQQIYVLDGGLHAWLTENYPLVKA